MSGRMLPMIDGSRPGFGAGGAAAPLDGNALAMARPAEPDDPVELVGVPIRIDDATFDEMAATFVEEFVRDGWGDRRLLAMFASPEYAALHLVWQARGAAWVRELIAATRELWGRPDPDAPAGAPHGQEVP